ncbi:hypothetical protein BW014_08485 [Salmonella enterica]|nr:hypothetical protein [Salmonella enterica]ECT8477467.1 hypothetical protein [Salmonella enterica]EIY8026493.1 hypothetical protein [Salmonella enterica subsp. enterica serovar Newport]EJJ8332046.1 hypothetical protein [Salmonella enterica]ELZ0450136.1 hypothetical protein [Salmonella enterica]
MNTGIFCRGVMLGAISDEKTYDGKLRTNFFLGVQTTSRNEFGFEENKTHKYKIGSDRNDAQTLNYFNSLKGKLVEVTFETRSGTLENGNKWSGQYVTGAVECKPESKG